MSKYKLLSGVYFGDKLFQAGEVVELDDSSDKEKIQGYIDRGTMVAYDEAEEKAKEEASSPAPVEGEVVREFVVNGQTLKQLDDNGVTKYTQDDLEIPQDAFDLQAQEFAHQEEEAARAAKTPETTEPTVPEVTTGNPSPEQIAQDLKEAGV